MPSSWCLQMPAALSYLALQDSKEAIERKLTRQKKEAPADEKNMAVYPTQPGSSSSNSGGAIGGSCCVVM
jgi:hypothetical protein